MSKEFVKVQSYESDVVSYINIEEIQSLSVSVSENGDVLMPAIIKFIHGDRELEIDYNSYEWLRKKLYGI